MDKGAAVSVVGTERLISASANEQIVVIIQAGTVVQFQQILQYPLLEGMNGDGI